MKNEEVIRALEHIRSAIRNGIPPTKPSKAVEALDLAISALERDKWISVKEELPDIDQDVLVMVHWLDYPEDMMVYGRRYKTRWYLWNGELGELIKGFDITHWRPLPEPPKEDKP
jgi:hypothetical protein